MENVKWWTLFALVWAAGALIYVWAGEADKALVYAVLAVAFALFEIERK